MLIKLSSRLLFRGKLTNKNILEKLFSLSFRGLFPPHIQRVFPSLRLWSELGSSEEATPLLGGYSWDVVSAVEGAGLQAVVGGQA